MKVIVSISSVTGRQSATGTLKLTTGLVVVDAGMGLSDCRLTIAALIDLDVT